MITVPETRPERMFGNLMSRIDAAPYRGNRVRFRAAVRAEKEVAMLWVRVDRGPGQMGFFGNMQDMADARGTGNARVDQGIQQAAG